MRIKHVGKGNPNFAIVCCVHGDETCGKVAIEQLLSYVSDFAIEFKQPVKFIIANERAVRRGTREVETDLNRAFPGDKEGEYEDEIAYELRKEVEDLKVLDLHSTHSYDNPVAFVHERNPEKLELARSTGASLIVDTTSEFFRKSLIAHAEGVAVECGKKGTAAAEFNAHTVIRNFLVSNQIIEGSFEPPEPMLYELKAKVEEPDYAFIRENFKTVPEGDVFAIKRDEQDNVTDKLSADDEFYPILMSTEGYEDILGYKGEPLEGEDQYQTR